MRATVIDLAEHARQRLTRAVADLDSQARIQFAPCGPPFVLRFSIFAPTAKQPSVSGEISVSEALCESKSGLRRRLAGLMGIFYGRPGLLKL